MTKTQTVQELLKQFNLDLDLPLKVLNLEVEGEYDSFEIIYEFLSYITMEGTIDYSKFKIYLFENDDYHCMIIPDNTLRTVRVAKKIAGNWRGYYFDCFGNISVRS